MNVTRKLRVALWMVALPSLALVAAQRAPDPVDEPFKGVTANGTAVTGLFPVRATGVSTGAVREAAVAFLASLTADQRSRTAYAADDSEWRKWNNVHRYTRQGVNFKEMTEAQQARAYALLGAGLSAKGLDKARNVMRLNYTIAELTKRFEEYGDGLYHLTVMGEPSATQPWGWQLDGHHLVVNYFVLGDQVVMTPSFMGSEPVRADAGKYAGTIVLQDEQDKGVALMRALSADQQKQALVSAEKTANNAVAQAFRDNLVLDYAGIRARDFTEKQRALLMDIVGEYVNNMDAGHARVRLDEVKRRLDDTWFAWIGGTGPESVFYYRIHSPVVLIEFDHQLPVALEGPRVPGRVHVHTVVRTPNGNDYGKDLLRQHHLTSRHD